MIANPASASIRPTESIQGTLRKIALSDLHLHPALVRLQIKPSMQELSAASENQRSVTRQPVSITTGGSILTGVADFEEARRRGETHLDCIEMLLNEEDAILWIIKTHRRNSGINDFNRIALALELEPWFRVKAVANQQRGGHLKATSMLTEAERCDVRVEVASAAGVSVGNVSKAKHIFSAVHPDLLDALRTGDLSINRAFGWMRHPETQLQEFRLYQNSRGIKRAVNVLLSKHLAPDTALKNLSPFRLANALLSMKEKDLTSIAIGKVDHPDHALIISSSLLKALERQGEFAL